MASKFQLPSLTPINVSLTEGTNIPPPQDSPDEPRPPTPGGGPLSSHPTTPTGGQTNTLFGEGTSGTTAAKKDAPAPISTAGGRGTSTEISSPVTSTRRPSSVRRFLGLKTMGSRDSFQEPNNKRPASRASTTVSNSASPPLSRKKSTGWFSKRKSGMFSDTNSIHEEKENSAKVPRGPPPPTIPEFRALGSELDGGNLGADDLFKNIK